MNHCIYHISCDILLVTIVITHRNLFPDNLFRATISRVCFKSNLNKATKMHLFRIMTPCRNIIDFEAKSFHPFSPLRFLVHVHWSHFASHTLTYLTELECILTKTPALLGSVELYLPSHNRLSSTIYLLLSINWSHNPLTQIQDKGEIILKTVHLFNSLILISNCLMMQKTYRLVEKCAMQD